MLSVSQNLLLPFFYSDETLELTDISSGIDTTVLRNARFSNLGMFRTFGEKLLVVYYDERFRDQFEENISNFAAVITTPELADTIPKKLGVIISKNPLQDFLKLHVTMCETNHPFYVKSSRTQIAKSANIHPSAIIADTNVVISDRVIIEPNVVINTNTFIDEGSHIGAGTIIGGRGFEVREVAGIKQYIPHCGGVAIGKNVDVFANSTLVRAVFKGATIIGDDCKIDNLVHIAHGAVIGSRVNLVAGSSIGGTTRVGDDTWIGPNAVLSNSIIVANECWVALGSVVAKDVQAGHRIGGPFSRRMP